MMVRPRMVLYLMYRQERMVGRSLIPAEGGRRVGSCAGTWGDTTLACSLPSGMPLLVGAGEEVTSPCPTAHCIWVVSWQITFEDFSH